MSAITPTSFSTSVLYTPSAEAHRQDATSDKVEAPIKPVLTANIEVGLNYASAYSGKIGLSEWAELPDINATDEVEVRLLRSVRSFAQLRPLAEQAQEHVSSLGERYIIIQDQKYPIDDLAEKVIALMRMQCSFGEKERAHGKKIAERITTLYEQNNERLKKMALLTRIRAFVHNLKYTRLTTLPLSKTQWMWEDNKFHKGKLKNGQTLGYRCIFELYTRRQYAAAFKQFPSDNLKLKLKLAPHEWDMHSDEYYLPPKI